MSMKTVKARWADYDKDQLSVSFLLMGIDDNMLDVGDNYRYLRSGDMLYSPRICDQFLVVETPVSAKVRVASNWGTSFYASMKTVANYFGVTIQTVKRWCRMGVIPADKNKNHWQVYRSLVMDETPELVVGDSLYLIASLGAN